jgi:L-ascorbate metabolism protein UlaG (beta-lactamase superfamily)
VPKARVRVPLLLAGLSAAAGAAVVAVGCSLSAPRYRGPLSDHFDGKRFRSIEPAATGRGLLRWILNRDRGPWSERPDAAPGAKPPERVSGGALRVTFVNHATVLVQMDGVNVLTDPVWSERVSPFTWVGPKRHCPPGIRFEDLPPIDAVLVSHNHYDHMDVATLRRLSTRPPATAPVLVGLGNAAFLETERVPRARDLDWWQSVSLPGGVTITAVPARHFSSRSPFDGDRTLWCGFVVSGPSGAYYFAGDTGWGSHFEEIGRRFPGLRLAMLPIGAYRPRWFMSPVHIDPDQAVRAQQALGAATAVAIHWGTFAQADDGEREPLEDLAMSLAARPDPKPRFLALENGEAAEVP